MLKSGVLCLTLVALSSAITCPDGGTCDDGSACCQTNSGGYGCCPLTRPLPMVHASSRNDGNDTTCPDGSHCPSEYSCLQSHNTYQCCPLGQGVSCSDGKHCCPEHHRCGEDGHSCIKEKELIGAVICPDGESECPEATTCCQLPDSSWGCCPLAKAVCCEDRKHCCPEGSTCDAVYSKCHSPTRGESPMWAKFPARRREAWEDQTALQALRDNSDVKDPHTVGETSVTCPDGKQCPDLTTCCQLSDGSYGCCPFPNAVCCSDHLHCCPSGNTCDLVHNTCTSASSQTPLAKKIPASNDALQALRDNSDVKDPHTVGETSVTCPDGKQCPDLTTCCQLSDGSYGCCPFPNAVCCSDHLHCCPSGNTCDLVHNTCTSASSQTPLAKKIPASNDATDVPCNDTVACEDGSTCCKDAKGDWACCPLPKAVCCEDHIHCCPNGSTCDGATCKDATGSVPWLEKVPALTRRPNKARNVTCDSSHTCPDGSTCCKTAEGDWACCPLPEAVCCEDHTHCCPKDTTCDVATGACNEATGSVPWLEKVPALTRRPNKARNVTCDSSHTCPDGNTCCKTAEGDWACCPLPEAVCCEDHTHCCPKDTTCDVATGACNEATGSVPWLEKVPALTRRPNKARNVTCDSSHTCPDGSTCCKTAEGDWACCPLPEAVCCEDHTHCCPKDTTCDVATGACNEATGSVPWLEKVPALTRRPNKARNVTCDSSHTCPDGNTCCKTAEGDWACCPLPEAVCCDDHIHCCPKDSVCNVAASSCDDATGSVPWLEKVPALPRVLQGAVLRAARLDQVHCDAKTSCPNDNTCCFMKSLGRWGCCPLPKAKCCADGDHCCPERYTCNDQNRCTLGRVTIPWYTKTEALASPALTRGVQCDPQTSCATGSTCCPLPKGQWGCCPLDKAVCCGDQKHCCPSGYTCDPSTGSCSKSTELRWDNWGALFRKRRPLIRL